jgi:Peptidase U49
MNELRSPVESLFGNIAHGFETASSSSLDQLKELVETHKLSAEIECEYGARRGSPYVRKTNADSPAVIFLPIAYLERLWAFIYGWFVVYEECVQREIIAGTFSGEIRYTSPLQERAGKLIGWSSSGHQNGYPTDLPSPILEAPGNETAWIEKTNTLFICAVAYVLYHEVAHVRCEHLGIDKPDPTLSIQIENEADDFAHHMLLSQQSEQQERRVKAWSILAPTLFGIWSAETPISQGSITHPALHHRLITALRRLDLSEPETRDYFNYLSFSVLSAYKQRKHGKLKQIGLFETTMEAIEALLNEIDSGHY